ncbi:MAG: hypothetical protein AAF125_26940, partial [Chloroflexota bacterium]
RMDAFLTPDGMTLVSAFAVLATAMVAAGLTAALGLGGGLILLAIMTALNAVLDLVFLTQNLTATAANGRVLNDAAAFALEIMPGTTARTWAWTWAAASVVMLGIAVYLSMVRPILTDTVLARRSRVLSQRPNGVYYERPRHEVEQYGGD